MPIRFEADQITDLALRARVEAAIAEVSAWEAERARLREEIRDVARGLSPQPGDKELVLVCVYAGEFNTQGFGADRYAEAHAEARADVARLHGIAVEVVRACQLFDGASEAYRAYQARQPLSLGGQVLPVEHAQAWHVVVRVVEDLDVEILKHHPGPDLVESVRLSWARGVNPRVANPWLPHDFEARHGLDHFGGRVTPAT